MHEQRPLSEVQPKLRLCCEEPAPKNVRIYLVSEHGAGFIGQWYDECGAVAWCPLPKLTPEQKRKLENGHKSVLDNIGGEDTEGVLS